MLLELKIKNLAIIESSVVSFGKGLNVITGETGAGKSILLEALNLIFGSRSDRELIRTEEKEADVQALFDLSPTVVPLLEEWGISHEEGEPLILRRVISSNGRSRGFINCVSVSANQLRQLAPLLVDFGRQHEQGLLLDADRHIYLLDRYADNEKSFQEVESTYQRVRKLSREHASLKQESLSWKDRIDFLKFQKKTIEEVNPRPNEEEEINQELARLTDVESCRELAKQAEDILYGYDASAHEKLSEAIQSVEEIVAIDDAINDMLEDLQNALISIEEGARTLKNYQKTLNRDPDLIDELQTRLDQVIELQQRYGGDYESVMAKLKEIDKELGELAKKQQRLEQLNGVIEQEKQQLLELAQKLSQQRNKAAKTLKESIESELKDLALANAQFAIRFTPLTAEDGGAIVCGKKDQQQAIQAWGAENIQFLFSANQGEELRPLEKVASGGELSRIMLAMKRIIGSAFSVSTFIFDEIDSGISGTAATMVAQKLRQIVTPNDAKSSFQAICISHTAQVAAEADIHFKSEKCINNNRTAAKVQQLDQQQRIQEISRILAGDQSPEHALALAQQLVLK